MRKFWAIAVIVYLLCALVRGSDVDQQTSLDSAKDLGVDMCPECQPLTPPVPTATPYNSREGDLGVDICPECQPFPPQVPKVPSDSLQVEDLGVDMCPECRALLPQVQTVTPYNLHEDDLGVDMCPECQSLPPLVPTMTPYDLHEEDLGIDMCPEKGQPMSVAENLPVRFPGADLNSLVKELHQLVKLQQSQIDQLAELLLPVSKNRPKVDLPVMDLPRGQTLTSIESSGQNTVNRTPEPHRQKDVPPPDLREISDQQNSLETIDGENSPQVDIGVVPAFAKSFGSGTRSMTVARYKPAWTEYFSFLSAVKVEGEVSCLHVLPQEGHDGVSRYIAVGDMGGRLYIFLFHGDLLLDYPTISTAPITAMLSHTVQKNETILVTGHADGGVLVHQICETVEKGSFSKDGNTKLSSIKTLFSLVPPSPDSLRAGLQGRVVEDEGINLSTNNRNDDSKTGVKESISVTNLEMFKVGKMRYTLVGDKSGKIQVFRDNGSLHGVAQSPSQTLTFMKTPSAQRLVFLTEVGVGSLDLRSMKVRINLCEGLNNSKVMTYAFDITGRTKAHGFTVEGHLVSVALTGDMLHFECRVKKKRKMEFAGWISSHALKGYLVAATVDHVLVFNTTLQTGFSYANQWFVGPTPILSVTMNEIALSFLSTPIKQSQWPLMATNRDKLVVVGFGDGYVGIFRSNLPIARAADFSAKFWNSSILISALVLLVTWQLFTRKRDPRELVTTDLEVPSGTLAFEKEENVRLSFGQTEKVAERTRFRSPTRGYVSTNPTFGSGSRRFSSPTVDSGGYSSRREPLFGSTQPVGELERLQ